MTQGYTNISIQYKGPVGDMKHIGQLRTFLSAKFNEIADILREHGMTGHTLQASSYSMSGAVPADRLEELEKALESQEFEVRENAMKQVLQNDKGDGMKFSTAQAKATKMDPQLIDLRDAFTGKAAPNEYAMSIILRTHAPLKTAKMATPLDHEKEIRILDDNGQPMEGVRITSQETKSTVYLADVTLNGLGRLDSDSRIASLQAPRAHHQLMKPGMR